MRRRRRGSGKGEGEVWKKRTREVLHEARMMRRAKVESFPKGKTSAKSLIEDL